LRPAVVRGRDWSFLRFGFGSRRPSGRRFALQGRLTGVRRFRQRDCVVNRGEEAPLPDPAHEMPVALQESLNVDAVERRGLRNRDPAREFKRAKTGNAIGEG
jgi:hypothetical protein